MKLTARRTWNDDLTVLYSWNIVEQIRNIHWASFCYERSGIYYRG
jgi:hypothetical protein